MSSEMIPANKQPLYVPTLLRAIACALLLGAFPLVAAAADYAIVVSAKTDADPKWHAVVEALRVRHHASVTTFAGSVDEALPKLRAEFPRFACFVATPEEAGREFVARVHRLTRRFDDDPYTDCFWGIVTGYDAANALRIVQHAEPLLIRKAASGTDLPLQAFEQGVTFSELEKGKVIRKTGSQPAVSRGPDDSTGSIVKVLNDEKPDLFVTSGHATERDWQIGFRYRGGQLRCADGTLFGLDLAKTRHPVASPNPKVYLAVGNCLMGHFDGKDAMAAAFLNSGGVQQMVGYTVNTWYGYGGWGLLDYFVEQPGRFTLAEAFFANEQALVHRLATYFPALLDATIDANGRTTAKITPNEAATGAGLTAQDGRGLLYDRDVVGFYGDPAWEARLASKDCAWEQALVEREGVFTFTVTPKRGAASFAKTDNNGSQRGGRPIFQLLPQRVKDIAVTEGGDLQPTITDNFLLIPNPGVCDPSRPYRLVFRARKL